MAVDMFPRRFAQELQKLPAFIPANSSSIDRTPVPAWRPIFTALLLYCHSTGYRLPSFASFKDQVKKAYTDKAHDGKYDGLFGPRMVEKMTERMRVWYESGLAETYLYSCLVFAIEDKSKSRSAGS